MAHLLREAWLDEITEPIDGRVDAAEQARFTGWVERFVRPVRGTADPEREGLSVPFHLLVELRMRRGPCPFGSRPGTSLPEANGERP
ncbi:hypothetical protein [Streptomyces sp. A5-4]|uniref:hypothetical protein n=1 Tax=Streptomyces sp. A5-4 TaxID=3384771 RepID=UPI003DA9C5F7